MDSVHLIISCFGWSEPHIICPVCAVLGTLDTKWHKDTHKQAQARLIKLNLEPFILDWSKRCRSRVILTGPKIMQDPRNISLLHCQGLSGKGPVLDLHGNSSCYSQHLTLVDRKCARSYKAKWNWLGKLSELNSLAQSVGLFLVLGPVLDCLYQEILTYQLRNTSLNTKSFSCPLGLGSPHIPVTDMLRQELLANKPLLSQGSSACFMHKGHHRNPFSPSQGKIYMCTGVR